MSTQPSNPPQTSRFQYYMQTARDTFSTARKAIGERVNALRGKIPAYQETIGRRGDALWNKLSPTSQRYVQLVWNRDAGEFVGFKAPYEKNLLEEVGDWMLFPMVDLPHKLSTVQNSPIAVGVGATAGALFSLKFLAHPIKTTAMIGRKIAFLPRLSYCLAQFSIIGLACRSMGRMTNTSLMDRFHAPAKPEKVKQD